MSTFGDRSRYVFDDQYYREVDTFSDLPAATGHFGNTYLVRTGSWSGIIYKRAGLYRSNGANWIRLAPLSTVSDADFALYNETVPHTKVAIFDCDANIAAGNTRTFAFPNASGTLALQSWVSAGFQVQGDVLDDLNVLGANPFSGDPNADFLVGTSAGTLAWQSGATARTSIGLGITDSPIFTKITVPNFEITGNIINWEGEEREINLTFSDSLGVTSLTIDSDYVDIQKLTVTNISAFTLDGKLTAGAVEIEGSAFDINGGTADALAIGGATPAAGAFTSLISDTLVVDTTTLVVNVAGYTDKVGIGTATPGSPLHVAKEMSDHTPLVLLENLGTNSGEGDVLDVYTRRADGFTDGYIAQFRNIVGTKVYIRGDGNVGIGTVTPDYILDIDAGEIGDNNYDGLRIVDTGWKAVSHPMLEFYNSNELFNGSLARIYGEIGDAGTNSKLYFAVADSSKSLQDRMVIDKGGNVGIGTTSPSSLLGIQGNLSIALTGSVAANNGSDAIVGTGTNFDNGEIAVGDAIKIESDVEDGYEIFTVSAIADDTHLTIDSNYAGSNDTGLEAWSDPGLFSIDNGDSTNYLTVNKSGNLSTSSTLAIKGAAHTYDGFNIGSADGSDQIGIYHDNSNAYLKWSDGIFIVETDEGTNTSTDVWFRGKGTGSAAFRCYDEDNLEYITNTCQGGRGYLHVKGNTPIALSLQNTADFPIEMFRFAAEGETQELQIYGRRTGDAARRNINIGISPDVNDTAQFTNVSNYLFDGNVGIGLTTVDANYKLIVRRAANVNLGIGLQSSELAIAAFNDALSANIPMRFYASEYNLLNGNVGINETVPQDKLEVNGTVLVKDKLKFTQDDGNEYIDSLNDGYMDYGATTGHRFLTAPVTIANNTAATTGATGSLIVTGGIGLGGRICAANGASLGDGGATNYSDFESDGTLRFRGAATVWNDMQFQISDAKTNPANTAPSWETFTPTTSEYAFSINDEVDTSANEIPHWWKVGTAGNAHIHITTKAINNIEITYAKFTVTFTYADVNEAWAEDPLTAEISIANPTAALTHLYLDLGDITLTNNLIETQMKCRVKRIDATTGTEYAGDIFITQIGIHFEEDTIGSRTETTK